MRSAVVALITSLALAVGAGTALAQDDASTRGYDETGGVAGVVGQIDSGSPPSSGTQPSSGEQPAAPVAEPSAPVEQEGNLPFTGLDLGIVLMLGAVLLGAGFVLRRAARGRGSAA